MNPGRTTTTLPDEVEQVLARLAPGWPAARLCVALSGGVDSVALLAACAVLRPRHPDLVLRALHVNHGLQAGAPAWEAHCRRLCDGLAVPLGVLGLALRPARGASVEAAARDARYAALAASLGPGEALLTAHHQDDQLETVLLQLLRGAGLRGLSAMPARAVLGPGLHLRPMLGLPRRALEAYCREAGLGWVEDPMNGPDGSDRGYLRARVTPALADRWPAAARSASRTARHLAEAQGLLDDLAAADAATVADGACLRVAPLAGLSRPRQANLLRWWLRGQGLGAPSTARLEACLRQMLDAREHALPVVRWPRGEIRRWRGRLYAMRPMPATAPGPWAFGPEAECSVPGVGRVVLAPVRGEGLDPGRLDASLRLQLRHGGERIQLAGLARPAPLDELFRKSGVPPWIRDRTPLLYAGPRLLAVGSRWIDAKAAARPGEPGVVLRWEPEPGA